MSIENPNGKGLTINRKIGIGVLVALLVGGPLLFEYRQGIGDEKKVRVGWEEEWLHHAAIARRGDSIPPPGSTLGEALASQDYGVDLTAAIKDACKAERERWLNSVAPADGTEYQGCIARNTSIELPLYDQAARYPGVDLGKMISTSEPATQD